MEHKPIKLMFWIGSVTSGWYVQKLCVFRYTVCVCAFNNACAKASMCNPSHVCVCVYACFMHGTFASFRHVPFVVVVDVFFRGFDDDP